MFKLEPSITTFSQPREAPFRVGSVEQLLNALHVGGRQCTQMQTQSEPEIVNFPPKPNICALGTLGPAETAFLADGILETPDVPRMVECPIRSRLDQHSPHPAWRSMQPELPQVAASCRRRPHSESHKDQRKKPRKNHRQHSGDQSCEVNPSQSPLCPLARQSTNMGTEAE